MLGSEQLAGLTPGWEGFWWGVGYIIKSTLVFAVAIIVHRRMRSLPAAFGHDILRAATVAVLTLAVLSLTVPGWQLPAPEFLAGPLSAVVPLQADAVAVAGGTATVAMPWWVVAVGLVWAVGFLVVAARVMVGLARLHRMPQTAVGSDTQQFHDAVNPVMTSLGLKRPVQFYFSDRIATPVTCGLWSPKVILPAAFSQWPTAKRLMVLQHELAHVKRNDVFWTGLATLVAAVNWFNPLAWLLRRRLRHHAELASDDCVLSLGVQGTTYARYLLQAARSVRSGEGIASVETAFANDRQLKERIISILAERKRAMTAPIRLRIAAAVAATLLVLPLASLSLGADTQPVKPEPQTVQDSTKEALPLPDEFVKVDEYPTMIHQETPVYPPKMKKAGVEGMVWVQALVDTTGTVIKVQVGKTSGTEELDVAAAQAAWKNKFTPAKRDGKPVAVWIAYNVEFTLSVED